MNQRQPLTQKSDYELIISIQKSNNPVAQNRLYRKYYPLIKAYSQIYANVDSYEDRLQEAYLIMLQTAKAIKIERIDENFKFSSFFKEKLNRYFAYHAKLNRKRNIVNQDEIEEDKLSYIEDTRINFVDKIDFNMTYNAFKNTLNDNEKSILDLLKQGLLKYEVAKVIDRSNGTISNKVNQLRKKYVQYMNENGYAIA